MVQSAGPELKDGGLGPVVYLQAVQCCVLMLILFRLNELSDEVLYRVSEAKLEEVCGSLNCCRRG